MKKTLLLTLEYPPMVGGVAHYYQHLVEHLPQDRIVVLHNNDGALLSTSRWIWPKWFKGLRATRKLVKEQGIEHILVGQILPLGTIALWLYWRSGVKYTVMTHAMDLTVPFGSEGSTHKQKLMRLIVKYAHRITTVSSFTKMQLESLLNVHPHQIMMVYPCPHINGLEIGDVDTAALDVTHALQGKKVLLSVGRLIQRKGVDNALKAFATIAPQHPDAQYVVVGDGPYREQLEQLVNHLHIRDRVVFTGKVNDAELAAWYARCTGFVMPTRELYNKDVEGFGIVYLEANSFGKPVIGGKSGGVLDVVRDGHNGFMVNPEDIEMLAKAMNKLLADPVLARQLGEEGRSMVQRLYQWNVQAQKIEHLLE